MNQASSVQLSMHTDADLAHATVAGGCLLSAFRVCDPFFWKCLVITLLQTMERGCAASSQSPPREVVGEQYRSVLEMPLLRSGQLGV